jgi:hypothetical protein
MVKLKQIFPPPGDTPELGKTRAQVKKAIRAGPQVLDATCLTELATFLTTQMAKRKEVCAMTIEKVGDQ